MGFILVVMKINNSYTTFRARLLNNEASIGKIIEGGCPDYSLYRASFIQIDPTNPCDINALKETADYWINGSLTTNIYYAACALRNKSNAYKNHEIFALTTQKSNYDKLNSDNILGLVHTSPYEDGFTLIEQLQGNPEYVRSIKPDYKGIGTEILESLKQIYDKLSCYPTAEEYVIRFYKKNGFIKEPNSSNYYTYCKII